MLLTTISVRSPRAGNGARAFVWSLGSCLTARALPRPSTEPHHTCVFRVPAIFAAGTVSI